MLENAFQAKLKTDLKNMFPGCIVLKNDPTILQGVPDILVLYKNKWAALECKVNNKARIQPNQEYYVSKMNDMSFARFIYPENREEILHELQRAFES